MAIAPLAVVPGDMVPVAAHIAAVGIGSTDPPLDKPLAAAGIPARTVDRAAGILPHVAEATGLPSCLHSCCPRSTMLI